jgi:hypothetical protein
MKRVIAGIATAALMSGGLWLGAGAAHADSGTWCPGQPMPFTGRGMFEIKDWHSWDMNVCHDWWVVNMGQGNVGPYPNNLWDGNTGGGPPPGWTPQPCYAMWVPAPCPNG